MRFFQSSNYKPFVNFATSAHTSLHPIGIAEEITRPVVQVKDTSHKFDANTKIVGETVLPLSYQPPTEVYRMAASQTDVVDTIKSIVWWGGSGENDWVYVEYRDKPSPSNPYPVWHDSLECQAWVLANGASFVQPTFRWTIGSDVDEGQALVYELVIAYDFGLTNVRLQKEVGDVLEYALTGDEKLDVNQTYFWAIRTKDSVGDYSEWSRPQAFTVFKNDPPRTKMIGSKRRIVIPFSDYHYDFNVGNLPDGDYQFRAIRVTLDENDYVISQQEVISEYEQRFFIVDHHSENPPEIIHVEYDPHNYRLKFDLRISDSQFRLYDIKEVAFQDMKDKVLGEDESGYHMDAFQWHTIRLNELIGRKRGLTSNPYISKSAILGWFHNETIRDGKDYLFDVVVMSAPEDFTKEFHWGVRSYAAGSASASEWNYNEFDNTDSSYFRKPSNAQFLDEVLSKKQPYYGKADPNGIVMNKTYFGWERGEDVRWDFALFYRNGDTYEMVNDSLQESLTQPFARVLPSEFYEMGITNRILELTNIEHNFYELHPQEVDKIVNALPNQDFFWKVRAKDGYDTSTWSVPQQSQDFNIHHFEWDIRNDDRFQSSNYIVLKVTIAPSVPPRKFEFPHFNWLNITNPQIETYTDQIRILEGRKAEVEEHLHSYYDSYINYLKRRIIDVRNYVLDSLINDGYFADGASFQGFVSQNLHDGPVTYNDGKYSSELDIHNEYMERIKDLHLKNVDGNYPWSPAYYIWQLDLAGKNFKSQGGKPLRDYKYAGMACENHSYAHCYLTTGSSESCPWFGRSDLGFCKGFVQVLMSKQQKDQGVLVLDHLNPPDINTDPQGFAQWAYSQNVATELMNAAANNEEELETGLGFDPAGCPMAEGAVLGQTGGPCSRYKKIDNEVHKHTCEICGERRYPQFIGVESDPPPEAGADRYSDLNPAGFAWVEIRRGDEQLSNWGPIASADQSRNPQHRFTGFRLRKSQLPGELNSDYLNDENEQGIKKPHFKFKAGETLPAPTGLTTTIGTYRGTWYPITKPPSAEAQVIEII